MLNKRQFLLSATVVPGLGLMAGQATAQTQNESPNSEVHQKINALINEYARTLDAGRIEDCAALFMHADFTIEGVASVRGQSGVADLFSAIIIYEDGTPRTKHLISNVEIEVSSDGKTARALSYLTVMQQVGSHPLKPIFSGAYADEFSLREETWAFVSRTVSGALIGDMSMHLTTTPN